MRSFRRFVVRICNLANAHQRERRLEEEIAEHISLQTAENIRAGLTPLKARREALLKFGPLEVIREQYHEEKRMPAIESTMQDIRFAARVLRKSCSFTFLATLILGLGIAACSTVFTLIDAALLKAPPFPQSDRIVFPWHVPSAGANWGYDKVQWGRTDFLFLSQEAKSFENLGAFQSGSFNLTGSGEPVLLNAIRASAGFFPALGVAPSLGRTFTAQDDQGGHDHVVILADGVWREKFAADAGIVGRTVKLNGIPYTVIGVMPSGFSFPQGNEMPESFGFPAHVQIWVPLALNRGAMVPAEPDELAMIGRLRPGVTLAHAQAEMDLLGQRLVAQYPQKGQVRSKVTLLGQQVTENVREPLLLMFGAVCLVLLIACSNVASLLLTRSLGRRREFSIRAALGATRGRLIRQLLTESLLLAGLAGVLGALVAQLCVHLARAFGPTQISGLSGVGMDRRVAVFTVGMSSLTGILFGLAPALSTAKRDFIDSLKESGQRSGSGTFIQKSRRLLVTSQIALAAVLLVAAGLLTRTFQHMLSVDPGFQPQQVLTFELSLSNIRYPDQSHIIGFYQEALHRLKTLPGVQSAGVVETIPMDGATEATVIRVPGRIASNPNDIPLANYTIASPGYFSAVGTPILRGRPFLESDVANSMPVAIISQAMAKKYWPDQDPLGKQVAPRSSLYPLATIIGIAGDVKRLSLRDVPSPEMYVPYTQKVWPSLLTMNVIVRTSQEPTSITTSVRETIHSIDPDLPLAAVRPLSDIVVNSMTGARFAVYVLGGFSLVSLLIATIGLYGIISYSVAQRTQEFGVRMALGAQRADIQRMVLTQCLALLGLGMSIGLAAALSTTRLMNTFLYGVQANDPLTLGCVSLLFLVVALGACYFPARRATRVNPILALRCE